MLVCPDRAAFRIQRTFLFSNQTTTDYLCALGGLRLYGLTVFPFLVW
jgi:hypothetical protein